MDEEGRIEAVKKALIAVLEDAQKAVDGSFAKIRIAVGGFDKDWRSIVPITKVMPKENSIQAAKQQIANLRCSDSANILEGLKGALGQLKDMAVKDQKASHRLILLTDGQDNNYDEKKLLSIHKTFSKTLAKFFAIGIGEEHNRNVLEKIVSRCGRYINTEKGGEAIESAISSIYQQSIASFQEVILATSQLAPVVWSNNNTCSSASGEGESICNWGNFSEGEKRTLYIRIDPCQLQSSLDLSKVFFNLRFLDPRGKKGCLRLPWKPNSVINPDYHRGWLLNLCRITLFKIGQLLRSYSY